MKNRPPIQIIAILACIFAAYYVSAIYATLTKPPKIREGTIAHIDETNRRISINSERFGAISCSFSPETIIGYRKGDQVIATIGYTPNWMFPNCRRYRLLALKK